MKLTEDKVEIERGEDFLESQFGISQKDSAHILNILRSKLYSNKILAVVREYCANAQDAHAEAGKADMPIHVYLPTMLEQTFRVRDFGPGLSEDEIRTLYVMYGASTKRNSNVSVGQLGLGCKAAFAYSDKFHVTSWHGGEKKVYCAYIDETKCGKIALMKSTKSDEPDGIEIQVPVKPNDFRNFGAEAAALLQFFTPRPEIHGDVQVPIREYTFEGKTKDNIRYGIHKSNHLHSTAIMGGIPYPISSDQLRKVYRDEAIYELLEVGIDIYVNIGDLEVTASREELEYTKHTTDSLIKHLKAAVVAAAEQAAVAVVNAATYAEANAHYLRMTSSHKFWGRVAKVRQWKGHQLDGWIIYDDFKNAQGNQACEIWRGRRWGRRKFTDCSHINAAANTVIIDVDKHTGWRPAVTAYFNYKQSIGKDIDSIYIITWKGEDAAEREENRKYAYEKRFLADYNPILLSDCKVEVAASNGTATMVPVARARSFTHVGQVFKLRLPSARVSSRQRKSGDWDRTQVVKDGTIKYYVLLHNFVARLYLDGKPIELKYIDAIQKVAQLAGLTIDDVYGVKIGYADKIKQDATWIPLADAAKEAIAKAGLPTLLGRYDAAGELPAPVHTIHVHARNSFPPESPLNELLEVAQEMYIASDVIANQASDVRTCLSLLEIPTEEAVSKTKVQKAIEKVEQRYTLLGRLGIFPRETAREHYYHRSNKDYSFTKKELLPELVHYVHLVEREIRSSKNA
jgi:hypothetical protein